MPALARCRTGGASGRTAGSGGPADGDFCQQPAGGSARRELARRVRTQPGLDRRHVGRLRSRARIADDRRIAVAAPRSGGRGKRTGLASPARPDGAGGRHCAHGQAAHRRGPGEPGHLRLVAPGGAGTGFARVRHAAPLARSAAGARTGPYPASRLPRQPAAERGRGTAVLSPGNLVDLGTHPRRTGTGCRHHRSKTTGRTAAPGSCALRTGTTPVLNPASGPGGQWRQSHATHQTTRSSRYAGAELESRASGARPGPGGPGRLHEHGAGQSVCRNAR